MALGADAVVGTEACLPVFTPDELSIVILLDALRQEVDVITVGSHADHVHVCLQAHHGDVLHTCCCIFVDDDVAIVLNQSQASVLSKFPEVLAHLFLVAAGARHGIDLLEVVEHGLITLSRHRYIARGVIFVNRACSEHHQQCGCEKVIL